MFQKIREMKLQKQNFPWEREEATETRVSSGRAHLRPSLSWEGVGGEERRGRRPLKRGLREITGGPGIGSHSESLHMALTLGTP